jgi:hypothetical protein
MAGNVAKTRTTEEKSPVKVRRKTVEILGFRRISVSWSLSGMHIGLVGDPTP